LINYLLKTYFHLLLLVVTVVVSSSLVVASLYLVDIAHLANRAVHAALLNFPNQLQI
jgi:hypothetical protein